MPAPPSLTISKNSKLNSRSGHVASPDVAEEPHDDGRKRETKGAMERIDETRSNYVFPGTSYFINKSGNHPISTQHIVPSYQLS